MCKALLPSAIEIAIDLDRGQVKAEGRSLKAPHRRKRAWADACIKRAPTAPCRTNLSPAKQRIVFILITSKTENFFHIW